MVILMIDLRQQLDSVAMKRRVHERICPREFPHGEREYKEICGRWTPSRLVEQLGRPGAPVTVLWYSRHTACVPEEA